MHPPSLYLPPSFLRVPGPKLLKLIATIKNVYCSTSEKGDDDNNDADTGGEGGGCGCNGHILKFPRHRRGGREGREEASLAAWTCVFEAMS